MEYYNINKKRIPVLGFYNNYNLNIMKELTYFKNNNILISNDYVFLITNKNNLEYLINFNNNYLLIGIKIKHINEIKNCNIKPNFILINKLKHDIINYCKKNNILIFFNGTLNKLKIPKNFLIKYNKTNNQLKIRYLIDLGLIFICNNKINKSNIKIFDFCLDNDDYNFLLN
jgi:hypothetical protein